MVAELDGKYDKREHLQANAGQSINVKPNTTLP